VDKKRKQYWLGLEMWTAEEAAVLLTGKDPKDHQRDARPYRDILDARLLLASPNRAFALFEGEFGEGLDAIKRAALAGTLTVKDGTYLYSAEVILWACNSGAWQAFPFRLADLPEKPGLNQKADDQKALGKLERETLLTIIAACLHELGCEPTRRGLASEIAGWTEAIGAPISDDRVRCHLGLIPSSVESVKNRKS